MNRIFTSISNLSIKLKISFGLLVLFLFFMVQSYVSFKSLNKIDKSFLELSKITKETVEILEVDKKIINLQKQILVYAASGRVSVFNKIQTNFKKIELSLNEFLSKANDENTSDIVKQLIKVLESFGESIPDLRKNYEFRSHLLKKELPGTYDIGRGLLKERLRQKNNNQKEVRIVQNDLHSWSEMNFSATEFFKSKKYSLKKSVYRVNSELLKSQSKNKENTKLILAIRNYKTIFDQAVQANRNFSALVNVVIAGDSAEFSRLSEQLRESKLIHLDVLSQLNKEVVSSSIEFAQIIIFALLLIMIAIWYFYDISIVRNINLMSRTFKKLLDGRDDFIIPGVNRNDEIGQLARAAQKLKNLNKEIVSAKENAEKSEKTQASFLANMSHEIRTPMNGILGMVHLLDDSTLNNEQRDQVESIRSCGDSLLTILNDILDISKIDAGKLDLEMIDFNLELCVDEAIGLLKSKADEKGIAIHFEKESQDKLWFRGDITRVRQILVNYISNAIKFTSAGSVDISIQILEVHEKDKTVCLRVKDSGIGISEKNQAQLFSPFTQADSSTTRQFGGTGLGLSICKKITESMGGEVFVESIEGEGTTFGTILKLQIAKPLPKDIVVKSEKKIFIAEKIEHKILVAEDNQINQKLIIMMLRKLGYSCDIAANGKEAIDSLAVKSINYSIVFMDLQMPVMDGLSATQKIRSIYGDKHPPIIALTANAFPEDKTKCLDAGMADFISKPVKSEDLVRVLRRFGKVG